MASAAITAAVLANPEAFANAAKTTVEAYGAQIENVGRAIDVLSKAATFIGSLTTKQALIINLSHKSRWLPSIVSHIDRRIYKIPHFEYNTHTFDITLIV